MATTESSFAIIASSLNIYKSIHGFEKRKYSRSNFRLNYKRKQLLLLLSISCVYVYVFVSFIFSRIVVQLLIESYRTRGEINAINRHDYSSVPYLYAFAEESKAATQQAKWNKTISTSE